MVLIDDPEFSVIEPFAQNVSRLKKLYDFDLMMDGGHIKGYKIEDEKDVKQLLFALQKIADPKVFQKKYSVKSDKVLLFAMGDGNHSLATAKAIWQKKKSSMGKQQMIDDPSRYALVELVNVHDSGLEFEPIHRILFNADESIFDKMKKFFEDNGSEFSYESFKDKRSLSKEKPVPGVHNIKFVKGKTFGIITIKNPKSNLEVGTLQAFLDQYLKETKLRIDYVHGEETIFELGSKDKNIGFLLPPLLKTELFRTVILDGALPRKTFSMGEADEKRFYLEARNIVR
jgi:hypothetical protein